MKKYDSRKALISIHIPKCAGSSFSNILKSWFGKGFLTHYHNEKTNKPPKKHSFYSFFLKKKLRRSICIHGHFNNARGNGVLDYYPETEQIITILREPFSLHLSNYFYVKKLAKNNNSCRSGQQHPIIAKGWYIEDYLRESKTSYICNFLPPDITLDNYKQIIDEKFLFAGVSERLNDSVKILAYLLGLPALKAPKKNISTWDETIPDGAREEFINNNPLEIAIYSYVKNILDIKISALNAQLTQ